MAGNVSKLEYLKKYMDGGSEKPQKKKKRVKKVKHSQIKIIDNQISFNDINNDSNDEDASKYELQEEKPLLFSEDGANVLTKEYAEEQEKKKSKWAPLNNKQKKNDSDCSPPRSRKRHDSDCSPPRRRERHDSDCSPQRQRGDSSDISPPRRGRHDSESEDLSPLRGRHDAGGSDLSPERIRNGDSDMSPVRRREVEPEVLSVGKSSGLHTGKQLRKENEKKKLFEDKMFAKMDASVSGKGAETVIRGKLGKKIDVKSEMLKKRKEEEKQAEEREKYAKWGKGVAQGEDYQQKLQDDLAEMQKPLARYKDDKDLDAMLKNRAREDDPMLAYMSKQKNKNKSQKPKYTGPPPQPNRFGIMPGYRYDGVDRSNGFEKKRFMAISQMKSFNTEKYKWSVEDM